MRREPAQEVSARRIGGVSERDQEEEQRRERVYWDGPPPFRLPKSPHAGVSRTT